MGVTTNGTFAKRLGEYRRKRELQLAQGLKKAGNILLAHSLPLVPLDTTALKDSGRVKEFGEGFGAVIMVGYGYEWGSETAVVKEIPGKNGQPGHTVIKRPGDYAVYQHFLLNSTTIFGGQADYLGEPGRRHDVRSEMSAAIKAAVK